MSIAFDRVFSEQDDTFTLQFVTGRTMSTSHASILTVSIIPIGVKFNYSLVMFKITSNELRA